MKKNSLVSSPHDLLFKQTFSRTETAAGFFKEYLPESVVERANWNSLTLQPGEFIDEELRGQQSDLLYSLELSGKPVLLYCLFEHQSKPDVWMPYRLLRYVIGVWEQFRRQNPAAEKLPPVLPLVLFQGGGKWPDNHHMSGLIDQPEPSVPELLDFQPDFRHLLVDLSELDSENLQGTLLGQAALLVMKAHYSGLHEELPRIFNLLGELLGQDDSPGLIRAVLQYICCVDNGTDWAHITAVLQECKQPGLEKEVMTVAEQLRKEGVQQGIEQGMQQGMQQGRQQGLEQGRTAEARRTLRRILEKRFGSVESMAAQRIENARIETLEAWIDLSLDASCVDEIFSA